MGDAQGIQGGASVRPHPLDPLYLEEIGIVRVPANGDLKRMSPGELTFVSRAGGRHHPEIGSE